MKKVTASELKHRLTLQHPIYSRDEMGGTSTSWMDVATLWAAIEPLRASEDFQFQKTSMKRLYRIRCRKREDIAPQHRLTFGTRIFVIVSLLDSLETGDALEIIGEEII